MNEKNNYTIDIGTPPADHLDFSRYAKVQGLVPNQMQLAEFERAVGLMNFPRTRNAMYIALIQMGRGEKVNEEVEEIISAVFNSLQTLDQA